MKVNHPQHLIKPEDLFGIDLRSLALFRIAVSAVLLFDFVQRVLHFSLFYTDQGLLPRPAVLGLNGPWDWSVFFMTGHSALLALLFLIHGFFIVLLLLGYRTRWATFVCWIFTASLESRNPLYPSGGDFLLRLMLFWSLFLPLGACASVDKLLSPATEKNPQKVTSVGSAVFLLQVALAYFFSVFAKASSEEWWDGTAVYYALRIESFTSPLGFFLLKAPLICQFLTRFVLLSELMGAVFLFMPVRTVFFRSIAIVGFILLHASFSFFMLLGTFPWICVAILLSFIPSTFWNLRWPSFLWTVTDKVFESIRRFYEKLSTHKLPGEFLSSLKTWAVTRPSRSALQLSVPVQILAAVLFIHVLWSNIEALNPQKAIPAAFRWLGGSLRLDQGWNMYTDLVDRSNFWFVVPGSLRDGTSVDVLDKGAELNWEKPPNLARIYKNDHWRGFLMAMGNAWPDLLTPYYGRYLCRQWNRMHFCEKELDRLEVFAVYQFSLAGNQSTTPYAVSLLKTSCSDLETI